METEQCETMLERQDGPGELRWGPSLSKGDWGSGPHGLFHRKCWVLSYIIKLVLGTEAKSLQCSPESVSILSYGPVGTPRMDLLWQPDIVRTQEATRK